MDIPNPTRSKNDDDDIGFPLNLSLTHSLTH